MSWVIWYSIAQWAVRLLMVPVILHRRFSPAASLAWLAAIFFVPEFGLLLYAAVGGHRLGLRRAREHRAVVASVESSRRLARQRAAAAEPPPTWARVPLMQHLERVGGMPLMGGNSAELLADAEETFGRVIADIDAATSHVHMVFYIFEPDATGRSVADALIRAARRGVACRVLADDVGSWTFFGRGGLAEELRSQGVQVHAMLPVNVFRRPLARIDMRNHRKLVVIDGRVGFTGSHNVASSTFGKHRSGKYVDLTGRFTGPIVDQLQVVFREDWASCTEEWLDGADVHPDIEQTGSISGQVVPTGPGHGAEGLPRVFIAALNAARRKVVLTTPYFVPDEAMMLAVAMAAERGVEINLVLPVRSDHPLVDAAARSYVTQMLEVGARVYRHSQGMLHAKTLTVDDSLAILGSANLDVRSFYVNLEMNVVLFGEEITRSLRFAQTRYISESERVVQHRWSRRPVFGRYLDQAAALMSPLL